MYPLSDEQWQATLHIYRRAQEIPEQERHEFVWQHAPDSQVAARVLGLLDEAGSGGESGLHPPEPAATTADISAGQRIGRYTITGVLGHGGMGDVFSAVDSELGRKVALKILRLGTAQTTDFFREARAASALNHPNIVTVYEVTREGATTAIAMEFVEGATVRTLCGSPQSLRVVTQIGQQVAAALAAAHAAGLVHRDVKPENVMVRSDGYVKVVDFGLARHLEAGPVTDPHGVPAGTVRYMSPEQFLGQRANPASDVFSLGLILFEIATGAHAFARGGPLETLVAISSSEPPPLRQLKPDASADLEALVARTLAKDPAARPSAAQVAQQLHHIEQKHAAGHDVRPVAAQPGRRVKWTGAVLGTALVAGGLGLFGWIAPRILLPRTPVPLEAIPFTSETGAEGEAALSPDGKRVAYVSDQESAPGIYIKNVDGGAAVRVAITNPGSSFPAWSPDGRSIAFLRRPGSVPVFDLIVIPASGGAERRVAEIRTVLDSGLTWSPDGKWLVTAASEASEKRVAIHAIPLDGGSWRRLTDPPVEARPFGDRTPAFSPDGSRLAFSRRLAFASSEVLVMPINSHLQPAGPPVPIPTGKAYTAHPAWLPDGSALLVSAGTERERRLFRIAPSPGAKPEILAGAGEFGSSPTLVGTTLVYTRRLHSSNLFWQPLSPGLRATAVVTPRRLAPSSSINEHPHISNDAKKVAFVSDRNGSQQIWSVDVETGTETRWTSINCPTVAVPRWSSDGRQITFTANCGHQTDVYVVSGPGMPPLRVTDSPALDENSTFSPDGRWVYFTSHREQGERIWRVPATGGPAEPVTRQVSSLAAFSEDGATLYFTGRWQERIALWTMPAAGGEPKMLRQNISYFVPLRQGILFSPAGGGKLQHFHFATGQQRPVSEVAHFDYVFSAPPSGSSFVSSWPDFTATDLMIVRDFR